MDRTLASIVDASGDEPWCPVTSTMQLIGNKWKPVVIHRLLENQPCGFSELKSNIPGISSKALSNTLKELERHGLVDRNVISDRPFRVQYSLTYHGEALEPIVRELERWGEQHLPEMVESDTPER